MNSSESILALFTFFLLVRISFSLDEKGYTALIPNVELFNQSTSFEETKVYRIERLDPLEQYEIRISWPCSNPAIITLQLVCANEGADYSRNLTKINMRNVLDVEKFIFETDSNRHVLNCLEYDTISPKILELLDPKHLDDQEVYLILSAEPNGVSSDMRVQQKELSFNLVIEPLRVGVSVRAIKTAMYTLFLLTLIVFMTKAFHRCIRILPYSKKVND